MNYDDFFPEADVATFRRVKRGQMKLAEVARAVVAEMCQGTVLPDGKEFVRTRRGLFRLAMAANSDNSTERAAHDDMGVTTVVMGDDAELERFFQRHGVNDGLRRFRRMVRARLR